MLCRKTKGKIGNNQEVDEWRLNWDPKHTSMKRGSSEISEATSTSCLKNQSMWKKEMLIENRDWKTLKARY